MRDAVASWWKRFVVAPHSFSLLIGVMAGACLVVQGFDGGTGSHWTPWSPDAVLVLALAGAVAWASRFFPFPLLGAAVVAVGLVHPSWADRATIIALATTLPTRLHARRRSELPNRLAFLCTAAAGWFSVTGVALLLVFRFEFVVGLRLPLGAIVAATFAVALGVVAGWRIRNETGEVVAAGAYRTAAPTQRGARARDARLESGWKLMGVALLACFIASAVVALMGVAISGRISTGVLAAVVLTNAIALVAVWQTGAIPPRTATPSAGAGSSTPDEPSPLASWKPPGLAFASGALRAAFGILLVALLFLESLSVTAFAELAGAYFLGATSRSASTRCTSSC